MRYEAPGAAFTSRVDGFDTGLVGTIGVRILDAAGATVLARTTGGIIESPAGSGSYLATIAAPADAGEYTIGWDDGTVGPGSFRGEQLVVTYTPLTPAATDTFATAADLAQRLGLTFSVDETARATGLLQLATGIIQDRAKQNVFLVTDDAYTRPGDYDVRVRLPERPVLSVSSVTLNGVALTEGVNYFVDRDELVRLNWNSVMQDSSFGLPWAGWGFPWWTLAIVYTHGYAVIPELVKVICMEMVVRVWVNPGSVAREMVGNTSTVYDNMRFSPSGMLLTDEEKKQIDRLLRRHSGSLTLR